MFEDEFADTEAFHATNANRNLSTRTALIASLSQTPSFTAQCATVFHGEGEKRVHFSDPCPLGRY
jgi:hypothetical protein